MVSEKTNITDEQLIDALFVERNERKTAIRLGLSRQGVNIRLRVMKAAGVNVPKFGRAGYSGKYTPQEVARLNEYIKQKTDA